MPDPIEPRDVGSMSERKQAAILRAGEKDLEVAGKSPEDLAKENVLLRKQLKDLQSQINNMRNTSKRQSFGRVGGVGGILRNRGSSFLQIHASSQMLLRTQNKILDDLINIPTTNNRMEEIKTTGVLDEPEADPEYDAYMRKQNDNVPGKDVLKHLKVRDRKSPTDFSTAGFRMLASAREDDEVAVKPVPEGHFHIPAVTKMKIKLKWIKEPRNVFIIKRPNDEQSSAETGKIAVFLAKQNIRVILEEKVKKEYDGNKMVGKHMKEGLVQFRPSEEIDPEKLDFIICLGGDGTILWASFLFPYAIPPVLSFRMGSLGFLTPFDVSKSKVQEIIKEDMEVTVRARLQVTLKRVDGSMEEFTCLNEVVAKHPTKMVSLDLYVAEKKITVVYADGLLISSPTGSTAYSLASGGSMVHPAIPAILLTPIAPHTLSFRPIVLPDSSIIKLKVPETARNSAFISVDGRDQIEMSKGDELIVQTSEHPIASYCLNGESSDWFDSIKSSFLWNVRTEQREHTVE